MSVCFLDILEVKTTTQKWKSLTLIYLPVKNALVIFESIVNDFSLCVKLCNDKVTKLLASSTVEALISYDK